MAEPFKFYECIAMVKMTGRRAADILELLEILKSISPESIFHHMHQYFLKTHIVSPEYPNDFAVWVSNELGDDSLAEGLANLNPYGYDDIERVRAELIRIITDHLRSCPPPSPVVPGKEFFFNEAVTIVIPTGLEASTTAEFLKILKRIDRSSIYFHFYEARLRLSKKKDDFSSFLEGCLGCTQAAAGIKALDPYMYSTEQLRDKIIGLLEVAQ